MNYIFVVGLIFIVFGQVAFASEERGAPISDIPSKNIQPTIAFSLPYELPDPITPTDPTPTQAPEASIIHDSSDPVELKALPGPINPDIPCELQVPWENGTPSPCKQLPQITVMITQSPRGSDLPNITRQVRETARKNVIASISATTLNKRPHVSSQNPRTNKNTHLWEVVTQFFKTIFTK